MKKRIKDIVIIVIITFLLLEVVLRLVGQKPYFFPPFSITSDPVGSLIPHSEMGLALQPGAFQIIMNDSLEYQTVRNIDSTRLTGKSNATDVLEFHGCSFTYGMGVDTEKAFPFLLQEKAQNHFHINNKAVPGYGNIQGLLSLKNNIKEGKQNLPNTIIMFYASFHDERNVLSPYYREHLYYGFMNMDNDIKNRFNNVSQVKFPYARIINDELKIQHSSIKQLFKPLPLREYSVISNAIQNIINTNKNTSINANNTSIKILMEMDKICNENGIKFIVASIVKDDKTKETLEKLREEGVETFDMGIDILKDNKYNNLPYDSHPNELAHSIYTDRLYHFLKLDPIH